ncbi:hypothetical protein NQD34_004876 [Periophthalmus magnuspinnatus]|nr:hypothetical protein NQD34_004876 [Periophthalmus magnuspinnatus]
MYHFIDVAMTWTEAQQYCRQHYTDLATIHNTEDLDKLTRPSTYTGAAWIGLFDDVASWKGVMGNDSNSWRWSVTGTTSMGQFQNWYGGEPNNIGGNQECVFMYAGLWLDARCLLHLPFVCFTGKTFFYCCFNIIESHCI